MSIITAYKSDADGRIFEDKAKYQKHLRNLAVVRRKQRKVEEAYKAEQQWWYDNFWNKVKSLTQLQAAIVQHALVFGANGLKNDWCYDKKKSRPIPKLVEWKEFNCHYSDSVSNSHRCPVDGETNCGGSKEAVPRGYPGCSGRFEYFVEWPKKYNGEYPGGSAMWQGTRIHSGTGCGGGFRLYPDSKDLGTQNFGYDFQLFMADWPGIAAAYDEAIEARDKEIVWLKLKHGTEPWNVKFDLDDWVNKKYPAEDYK